MNNSDNHWLDAKTGSGGPSTNENRSRTHRKPAWVYAAPVLMLLGLALVFAYAFRDRLLPGIPVEVAVAVGMPEVSEGVEGGQQTGGQTVLQFQATGWIEPDPLPIRVTSLYSGVTRSVHVLEGQTVTNGQLIATLVDDDTRLALAKATARLDQARAMQSALEAELKLAKAREMTAERRSESEIAKLAVENDQVYRLRKLREGTVPERERVQAELKQKSQSATTTAAAAVVNEWKAEAERIAGQIAVQKQSIAVAEVALDEAKLAQSRTFIRSPVNGVVLRLLVTPGKRLMLNMEGRDVATAAILYEPDKLQARVDVPLGDAGRLLVGQRVRVSCNLLPNKKFAGTVTRIVGEADLQRNTLQAKVRIADPDPRLRPEMLCRAEFFGTSAEGTSSVSSSQSLTVYVPAVVVRERDGDQVEIWKVSTDGRHAERQQITLGTGERDGNVPVLEGLRPGDRVILNPPTKLQDGDRIRVSETNATH